MAEPNTVLNDDDLRNVVRRYQRRISEHGATFESLCSGNPEKQRIRHTVHATALRGERPAVLDIGCGLGDFYTFLRERGFEGEYTGYDIVPEYIEACQRAFPEARFEHRNIFDEGIEGEFDTIVMSQVFNNHYSHSDNYEVIQQAIRLAFGRARASASIDMLSTYVDFQNPEVFYYEPEAMFKFAKSLTPRVCLRHDYRPYEYCLQLYHETADGFVR